MRLRSWTDRDTGMVIVRAEFDPESGMVLLSRVDAIADRMFHAAMPDECPTGDAKQDYLRAAALLQLVQRRQTTNARTPAPADLASDTEDEAEAATEAEVDTTVETTVEAEVEVDTTVETTGEADLAFEGDVDGNVARSGLGGVGLTGTIDAGAVPADRPDPDLDSGVELTMFDNRCEMIIVIDWQTIRDGLHEHSIIANAHNIDLPVESYRRMACNAAIIPAVLDSNGVVLDLGRTARLATKHQRRALLAMYDTCAIPGCTVNARHCEPHHILWWQRLGDTDLGNLVPICSTHHHNVHEGGWQLAMHRNRSLTITYPDGATQHTGPPATQRPGQHPPGQHPPGPQPPPHEHEQAA